MASISKILSLTVFTSISLFLLPACSHEPQKEQKASSAGSVEKKTCEFAKTQEGNPGVGQSPVPGGMSTGSPRLPFRAGLSIEKAQGANAHTVSEIHGQRFDLDGHEVVVRGEVVKVSSGIMGKNWLHIQDGSGREDAGDYDLTVTTLDEASPGDIVLVTGKIAAEKDFGHGYRYNVIIEDAKIVREKGKEENKKTS